MVVVCNPCNPTGVLVRLVSRLFISNFVSSLCKNASGGVCAVAAGLKLTRHCDERKQTPKTTLQKCAELCAQYGASLVVDNTYECVHATLAPLNSRRPRQLVVTRRGGLLLVVSQLFHVRRRGTRLRLRRPRGQPLLLLQGVRNDGMPMAVKRHVLANVVCLLSKRNRVLSRARTQCQCGCCDVAGPSSGLHRLPAG
jgi:hypothetical protein